MRRVCAAVRNENRSHVPLLNNVEDATVGIAAAALHMAPFHIAGFQEISPESATALGAAAAEGRQLGPELLDSIVRDCCSVGILLYHKPLDVTVCDTCHAQRTGSSRLIVRGNRPVGRFSRGRFLTHAGFHLSPPPPKALPPPANPSSPPFGKSQAPRPLGEIRVSRHLGVHTSHSDRWLVHIL